MDERDFADLASATQRERQALGFLLNAWVFLPDHWHAIIFPRHPLTISRVMKAIKLRSTHDVNLNRQEVGAVWQARFFEHALRTVKEYHDCISYIHLNPVTRGLVQKPDEWEWSSVHSYSKHRPVVLPIDQIRIPADPKARLY